MRSAHPHPAATRRAAAGRMAVLVAVVSLLALPIAAAAPEKSLPVTVAVAAPQTLLRSGPGDDFYPTDRLSRSAEVEVWAIDDSGYCAVRPVDGSFSWLRAADVLPEDGGRPPERGGFTGVVVTDAAVARVGSQLNELRHVSQVALEAGERVRVLARVAVAGGRHAGEWVRIAPPAGEFRWVWAADLALPAELAPVVEPEPATTGLAAAGEALAAIQEAGAAVTQAVAAVEDSGVITAEAPPAGLEEPKGMARLLSGWLPRGTNMFDLSPPQMPPAVAGAAPVPADELADVDLALSLAVAGSSEDWNLEPIRERLRLAAARATTAEERTRAEAIDTRLARFEALKARQAVLAAGPAGDASPLRLGSMWSSLSAVGSRPVRPGVLPGGRPADGRPDWTPPDQIETTGRLATVISRRPDAPRWALVDGQNNVLVFITPRPGVSLAPLVGQQVTVRGAEGYMPEYKRPYLVASEARPRIAAAAPARGDATQ